MSDKKITEREMIQELLSAKILFPNYFKITSHDSDDLIGQTLCLFVNCNDLFDESADSEDITDQHDLKSLYNYWKSDPNYGVDFWCCKKRNMKPKKTICDIWKRNGIWNDEFENLNNNPFDNE